VALSLIVGHPIADAQTVLATLIDLNLDWLMVDRGGITAMEYGVIAAGIVLMVATAAPRWVTTFRCSSTRLPARSEPVLLRRKKRRQVVIWQATQ
jgi:hypothetical protein